MKTKKLLAIILSLALLIGLVPVAGMLTTGAAAETDLTSTVYEIAFDATEIVDLGNYVASGNYTTTESDGTTTYTTVYDVSFDYYLDCETEGALSFNYKGLSGGSSTLTKGLHSVNFQVTRATTDKNNGFTPKYTAASDLAVDCTLYAWNLVVKANNTVISHYYHGPWQCTKSWNGATHTCTRTTATVTTGSALSTYPFAPNADGSVKVQQVYVDQAGGTGSDETGDGSETLPYASLYKAMTDIENSLYLEGEIIIVGDYTAATAFDMTADTSWAPTTSAFTQWSKPVTIRGAVGKDTNHLYLSDGLYLYGATTFDDLTINKSASNGNYTIRANHNEIVFGENVHIGGTMTFYGGVYIAQAPNGASAPHKITMNANAISTLYLGNLYNHASTSSTIAPSRRIPGVEYVQNSGTVSKLRIGAAGHDSYKSGNVYTDNVNITINGGKVTTVELDILPDQLTAFTSFTNGAALQFIFNNGTTSTVPTAAEIKALATDTETNPTSGDLYVLNCAAGGSQLAVTDEAGVYTVANPNYIAVATDGTNTYRSENGVLTVPAGTYDVTWEAVETFTVYVDDSGNDEADGTLAAPYKTLLKAVQVIEASGSKAGVINVVDTLTAANAFAMTTTTSFATLTQMHTVPITIQGANGTASVLDVAATTAYSFFTYGDVTIDNITVNGTSNYAFFTNKHHFTFGPDAVVNDKPNIYLGHYNANNTRTGLKVPTEPICLTLGDQTYKKITLGGIYNRATSYSKAGQYAGFDVVLNGAKLDKLHIGHYGNSDNSAGNIYTDDVNITVNGGNITTIVAGDEGTNTFPTTFVNNALQFILNNGTTLTATLPTAEAVAAMDGELYVMKGAAGVYLTATEDAGVYAVEEGKIAVAKNGDVVVAVSHDGKLAVPAGTYDVTYVETAPYTFDEENGTVTVNADVTVDFAGMPHKAVDGALFKGYVDGDGNAAQTTLTAGTVLTAEYIENWNESFYMYGSSLREAAADKVQALRFIVQLGRELKGAFETVEYGTVLLPNEILFLDELALGKTYAHDNGSITTMYNAAAVVGEKLYRDVESEDFVRYTAALTGITEKNYLTAYAARGYMTYTDLNGVARTVYTDSTDASSLNEVAEKLLEIDSTDATAKTIAEAAKSYAVSQSGSVALTPSNAAAMLYGSAESTFSTNVDANGVYTTADGREIKYTANGANGTVVREIVIDSFGDNANVDDTVIAQLTDLHFNYANAEDMLNEYTKYSWENRLNMNSWNLAGGEHYTIGWHERALKYATAISDQVVITGDLMDYYSLGNMQLVERLITKPYSNALMLVGNHDIDSVVYDSGSATPPTDAYYESDNTAYYDKIQTVWTNDVYYTRKLVGKEVMVIQMDNGRDTFREEQITALTADLALAREKGYTVLLFMHIPLEWESAELLYGDNLNSNGIDGAESEASAQMLELIKANGDVVRGIFAGHVHDDIYSAIPATYVEDGVTKNTTIPQFTLRGGFVAGGNVLKITVKDVGESDEVSL